MPVQTENYLKETEQINLSAISCAPHVKSAESVKLIMWTVAAALLPSAVFAGITFGLNAVYIMAVSVLSAMIAEAVIQLVMKKPLTILDGSAAVTGLLVAMNVPHDAPVWISVAGAVFVIIFVKQLFGGLGFNLFNPALTARAAMMLFWSAFMTEKWYQYDGMNAFKTDIINRIDLALPMMEALSKTASSAALKTGPELILGNNLKIEQLYDILFSADMLKSLFFGNFRGGLGEISVLLLLIGGIFLIARKIISWQIPAVYIGTVGIISYIYYALSGNSLAQFYSLYHVFSGGLFLGAFFMATDPVTTPITGNGKLIFAVGCGILTFFIRFYGSYSYGVCFAILIMNAFVPLIDRFVKPKLFSTERVK